MDFLETLTSQMAGATMVGMFGLGNAWITEGHGLHPILVGALLVVLFIAPHALAMVRHH